MEQVEASTKDGRALAEWVKCTFANKKTMRGVLAFPHTALEHGMGDDLGSENC